MSKRRVRGCDAYLFLYVVEVHEVTFACVYGGHPELAQEVADYENSVVTVDHQAHA